MTYEKCPRRFKYQYVDKLPQLPEDTATSPLVRGRRVHSEIELYIKGEGQLTHEIKPFVEQLDYARELFVDGVVNVEESWLHGEDWQPCEKKDVWLWAVLDLCIRDEAEKTIVVVDHKTGKAAKKIVEYVQQGQLYAALAALRYKWVQTIYVEFWCIDDKEIRLFEYTREEALRFLTYFQNRVNRLYAEKYYPPRPNIMHCSYCPFGKKHGTDVCPASPR